MKQMNHFIAYVNHKLGYGVSFNLHSLYSEEKCLPNLIEINSQEESSIDESYIELKLIKNNKK